MRFLYQAGIILGMALAVLCALAIRENLFPNYGFLRSHWTFFGYSLFHILVLWLGGLAVSAEGKEAAGTRLQTGGYLYALMGFGLSLSGLNTEANLSEITPSLMGALLTSIMGWFLGGEIAAGAATGPDTVSMQHHFHREVDLVVSGMRTMWVNFANGIKSAETSLNELIARQNGMVAHINTAATNLKQHEESATAIFKSLSDQLTEVKTTVGSAFDAAVIESLSSIGSNSKLLAANLSSASGSASETAKFLGQSRTLVAEMGKLLGTVERESDARQESLERMAESLRLAVEPLLTQMGALERQIIKLRPDA